MMCNQDHSFLILNIGIFNDRHGSKKVTPEEHLSTGADAPDR